MAAQESRRLSRTKKQRQLQIDRKKNRRWPALAPERGPVRFLTKQEALKENVKDAGMVVFGWILRYYKRVEIYSPFAWKNWTDRE